MSISALKQPKALSDLEDYLKTVEVQPAPKQLQPLPPPPPPPPPPISAQKPAIFDTGESKKRLSEAVTQDEKESEKRLKVTQVAPVVQSPLMTLEPVSLAVQIAQIAPVTPNVQEKSSKCTYTIIFSNNKKMLQLPNIITREFENKFISFLRDSITVFKNNKNYLDEAFDKATILLNIVMRMNIKPMILTIGTNANASVNVVTDTAGLYINYDFFGSNEMLFVYRFLKITNIDSFDKQVISEIKNDIAILAKSFANNTKSLANFAESDAEKAKRDLNTAHENAKLANRDFNTAQENAAKAKRYLKTAYENAMNKSDFDISQKNVTIAQKNVITAQENVITTREKLTAAQKNITTAQEKSTMAQADAILTRDKASNAAKDADIKTINARHAKNNTKDKEKINLPRVERHNVS
jgi:hypothetical protein